MHYVLANHQSCLQVAELVALCEKHGHAIGSEQAMKCCLSRLENSIQVISEKGGEMVAQVVTEIFTARASTLLHRTESYSTIIQERATELLSGELSQNRSVDILASWLEQWLDIDYIDDLPPLHRGILDLGLAQIDWQVIAREFIEALEDTQP